MLEKPLGGRGILLGGVPGVAAATVMVIGGGVVGMNAAFIAIGMEADVFVFDTLDRPPARARRRLRRPLLDRLLLDARDRGDAAARRPRDRRRADPRRARAARDHARAAGADEAGTRCSSTSRSTRAAASRPRARRPTPTPPTRSTGSPTTASRTCPARCRSPRPTRSPTRRCPTCWRSPTTACERRDRARPRAAPGRQRGRRARSPTRPSPTQPRRRQLTPRRGRCSSTPAATA